MPRAVAPPAAVLQAIDTTVMRYEMWEKVAQLDADYNYRMADWVAHGGKDKLAEFQKAHARLKEAWAVFGDGE